MMLYEFKFNNKNYLIEKVGVYQDGSSAIRIYRDGEPYTTLTVNLNYGPEKNGFFLIKTWGSNSSICQILLEEGIFWDTGDKRYGEHVTASVWKLMKND